MNRQGSMRSMKEKKLKQVSMVPEGQLPVVRQGG